LLKSELLARTGGNRNSLNALLARDLRRDESRFARFVFSDPHRMANGDNPLLWYAAELVDELGGPVRPSQGRSGVDLGEFHPSSVEHQFELALETARGEIRELRARLEAADAENERLRRALAALVVHETGS